jgi:hypothetical protein
MASLFVHLTVVPTDTVIESGTYAAVVWADAPRGIDTVVGDAPPGVGVGEGVVGIGEEEPPPQPPSATMHVRRLARHMCCMYGLFCSVFHCSSGTLNRSCRSFNRSIGSTARSGLAGASAKRSIFAKPRIAGRKCARLERFF